MRRVKVCDSQLGHLSSDTIEAVSEKVLDRAEGLTTGQLQARLAREVMEIDPKGADVGYYEGLAGYGPIIADIARKVAAEQTGASWEFSVNDDDGNVIATDITRRRPTAAMKRQIEAVYPTCVAPGCRMPAYKCDLDHRRAYSRGGPTHNDNMGPLCRYHHMSKHHAPWGLERLPNGDHSWTSPLGHVYIRRRAPPV